MTGRLVLAAALIAGALALTDSPAGACPYPTPEEDVAQGCTTTTVAPTSTVAPTTTSPPPTSTTASSPPSTSLDATSPPVGGVEAPVPIVLAHTGSGTDLAVGGALAFLVGGYLVWLQQRRRAS